MTLQSDNFFWICGQFTRHPLTELFHLSNLLQMLNDCRMADVEFLGTFLCRFKRISYDDRSQLVVVNFRWLATALLIFKALIFLAKLESPLHYMSVSNSWPNAMPMLWVVSAALWPILNSNKKNPHIKKTAPICFLSNILSIF